MNVRVVESLDELRRFRGAWNHLADRSETATVFQTFEWLEAWWTAFGADERLRAVLLLDGARLVAAAPLLARSVRAWGRTLTSLAFTGGMQTDYSDLLFEDDRALRRLVQALRTEVEWDHLDLSRIPAASPTAAALTEAFPGWRGTLSVSDVCPAYVFDAEHDGSDILGKKSIRRHVGGMQKAGTLEIRHLTEAAAVEPALDEFFQQHVERRSLTSVESNFTDPRARTFYGLVTPGLAARGELLFTEVLLDGKAAAYHYGFVHRRRLIWYKPTFAPHLARLSPGEVLLAELFKYCREHALVELDFTVGDEAFKTRFSNVKRENVRFQAYRRAPLQALDCARRGLKTRAKRVKAIETLVRRLRR